MWQVFSAGCGGAGSRSSAGACGLVTAGIRGAEALRGPLTSGRIANAQSRDPEQKFA